MSFQEFLQVAKMSNDKLIRNGIIKQKFSKLIVFNIYFEVGGINKKFTEVPFTGEVTGKVQGSFKNGEKIGSWVKYYKNGNLDSKGKYQNDKKEGFWITYFKNGKLESQGNYKNGKKEGSWIKHWDFLWYSLMKGFYKGHYINGKKKVLGLNILIMVSYNPMVNIKTEIDTVLGFFIMTTDNYMARSHI